MPINLPIKKLSIWRQLAFAAAVLERMLPNYQLFSESSGFGQFQLLRNQLDLVWQHLGPDKIKLNAEVQLEKLEEQIPEVNDYDSFGVYPALDTCMALSSLMQCVGKPEEELIQQVSQLSVNSVSSYVELLLNHEMDIPEISSELIKQHPLIQWEKESQSELFDFVKNAKENKQTINNLKQMALAEGVSNLGIEI